MKKYYPLLLITLGSFLLLFGKRIDSSITVGPIPGDPPDLGKCISIRLDDDWLFDVKKKNVSYFQIHVDGSLTHGNADCNGVIKLNNVKDNDIIQISHPKRQNITLVLKNTNRLKSITVHLQRRRRTKGYASVIGNINKMNDNPLFKMDSLIIYDFENDTMGTYENGTYKLENDTLDKIIPIGFKMDDTIYAEIYLITNPPNPKLDVVFDDNKDKQKTNVKPTQKKGSGN